MDIDKKELKKKFLDKDWNYVFSKAIIISDFIANQKFKIYNQEKRADIVQECAENLWKKIIAGKCDPDKNLFSFFWKNSTFRILEILRKENNRNNIAYMVSFDENEFQIYNEK